MRRRLPWFVAVAMFLVYGPVIASAESPPVPLPPVCNSICGATASSADLAIAFDGTGSVVKNVSQLPSAASVKVGVSGINPFRFAYRIETSVEATGAALAVQMFGSYAPPGVAVPGAPPSSSERGMPSVPGTRPAAAEACSSDDKARANAARDAAKGAIQAAMDDAKNPVISALQHLDQSSLFLDAAKAESLSASNCRDLCGQAIGLQNKSKLWDVATIGEPHSRLSEQFRNAQALIDKAPTEQGCRAELNEAILAFDAAKSDLETKWARLTAAQPTLKSLDQALADVLGGATPVALTVEQFVPVDASTVRARLLRKERMKEGAEFSTIGAAQVAVGRSRFSFSLGLGFMGLPERKAVRIAAPGENSTVATKFAYDVDSQFSPSVVGMLNAEIIQARQTWPWCKGSPPGHWGLALSAGVQPSSDTKRLRYLVALSPSFLDASLFLSLGAAIGQVEYLSGGFRIDQVVPDGLTEIPVRQDWKVGWFGAVTYRIR